MSVVATDDRAHLRRALELAERGRGRVSPNPLVGAVLVREGEVLGEGHHAEYGDPHAEVAALEECRARGNDVAGATLYVTLEPCAHRGKQPPCADAIVNARIARVVIGADDPSEKASGRGPGILRDEGVEVSFADGAEATAARLQNQAFRKHARTGRPLVIYKAAASLDGRVATAGGESRWISGAESRALVHRWRAESDAVAVGIGTALADDPLLTARPPSRPTSSAASSASARSRSLPPGTSLARSRLRGRLGEIRQPARVIFDQAAMLPVDSVLLRAIDQGPVILVAGSAAPKGRVAALEKAGADVIVAFGKGSDRVAAGFEQLGRRGITSVLLEGGPRLAGSCLDAGELDEVRLFLAPILLGDAEAKPVLEGRGAERLEDAVRALSAEWERCGEDLLVRARLREW